MKSWADSSHSRKAGIVSRERRDCQETLQAGWTAMINLAAKAVRTHNFDGKSLCLALTEIARRQH